MGLFVYLFLNQEYSCSWFFVLVFLHLEKNYSVFYITVLCLFNFSVWKINEPLNLLCKCFTRYK